MKVPIESKSMQGGYTHRGVQYFITLEKVKWTETITGYYASVGILFEEGSVILSLDEYFKSEGHESSLLQYAKDFAEGYIDSATNNSQFFLEDMIMTQDIATLGKRIAPRTIPSSKESLQIKKETQRLFLTFTQKHVADLLNINGCTVRGWKHKDIISANGVLALIEIKDIQEQGFTKQSLRPDVAYWGK